MKSKDILCFNGQTLAITKKQTMQEFLSACGREAHFTSQVFYIELEDGTNWVLKLCDIDAEIKELTEVMGEAIACKVSQHLNLDLVPKTQIVSYDNRVGTIQEYISNTIDKRLYYKLLSAESEEIQKLKLFWFILGQWDTSIDNVLFTDSDHPVAIDNANVANIQRVEKYGAHPFVRLFYCDKEDDGSLENPIIIKGNKITILHTLEKHLGELPNFFKSAFAKNPNTETQFTYFVEKNRLWRNFADENEQPLYFMKNFSKIIFEKFKTLKLDPIFQETIKQLMHLANEDILPKIDKDRLPESLTEHFVQISEGIEHRIKLVQDYYDDTHPQQAVIALGDSPYFND